jgi:hypothetical protein
MTIKLWPFRPDWEGGILEKLEWLTDVMASTKGAEQRRPQRLTPRKVLEATFLPHGRGRQVFDLYVSDLGNEEWYIPLWYDVDTLTATLAIDGTELETEVGFREFTLNGFAVVRVPTSQDHDATTFTFEIVKVVGRTTHSLLIERAQEETEARAWPVGSEIYPLRKARFTDQPVAEIVTAGIHSSNMSFTITEPNEWSGEVRTTGYGAAYGVSYSSTSDISPLVPKANLGRVMDPAHLPLFEGLRVLNVVPDYNQNMTYAYDRVLSLLDNSNGIPTSFDQLGYGVPTQKHTWFIHGREELARLRTLLYWLRGKVRPLWVPTFNDDLQLIAPADSGAVYIDVADIGYVEHGSGINRQVVAINLNNGAWIFRRVVAAVQGDGFERLELSAGLPQSIAPSDVYKISFMSVCRMAQDSVELSHETDSVGLTKAVTTFRATPDIRQYLPWMATMPSSPQQCPRTCQGMTRVDDIPSYGFPNFVWSADDCLTTSKGAYMRYKLAYSQTYVPWYDTEITDNEIYLAFDEAARDYWTFHGGSVYDQAADAAYYDGQIAIYKSHTRAEGQSWIFGNFPPATSTYSAGLLDAEFQGYYLKLRSNKDFETYTHNVENLLACHPRRWLPMEKLATVPATCEGGMLASFCTQSIWTVEEERTYPNQARGAATLYTAGVIERLQGVDSGTWPTTLALKQGIFYRMSGTPIATNGMYRNCGCIPLQFEEIHMRLSAPTSGTEDPAWVHWFHYAQMALLTASPWPTDIRVLVYDSLSNVLLRTLDLTIENFEVTAKADEYHVLVEDADYTANLVVFREMYNREPEETTGFHPDPWEGIWNMIPVAVDGVKIEIYER